MFILGIDSRRESMVKTGLAYLLISLFCVLFGAVYEHFSHQVYSCFMVYAFVFPLAGGALPFFSLAFFIRNLPGKLSCALYHSGIAAWTTGSLLQGVLEIYETTNRLVLVYWGLGTGFLISGLFGYWFGMRQKR